MFRTDEYVEAKVMSAGPHRLHLIVVDSAIQHSRTVIKALATRDFELSHTAASRARDCLTELIAGLRVEPAPELVGLVKDYFLHAQKNLVFADLLQDAEAAQKALELLESYRATWVQLRSKLPQG